MDIQTSDVSYSGRRCQTVSRKAAPDMPWSLSLQVGDIIQRIHPGVLPMRTALVVERYNAILFWVVWSHSGEREYVNSEYYEVISASR